MTSNSDWDDFYGTPASEPNPQVLAHQPGLKVYGLIWHITENDAAWFADHPDRQYRVRPVLHGEGTATRFSGKTGQFWYSWFIVRRDLECASFSPLAPPIDDEELCARLFDAYAGLGRPSQRRLERVQQRWLSLLDGMPASRERDLARARLTGAEYPEAEVRRTLPRCDIPKDRPANKDGDTQEPG